MRLDLDFGRGLVGHVMLDDVTDAQYAEIADYFVPLINEKKLKSRDAIGRAFVLATEVCPDANPSDLWHHVLYRMYIREKIGTDPSQSWVRTSGRPSRWHSSNATILFWPRMESDSQPCSRGKRGWH